MITITLGGLDGWPDPLWVQAMARPPKKAGKRNLVVMLNMRFFIVGFFMIP
jgi:hypothetical protein